MDIRVRQELIDFVVDNYLFGDVARMPTEQESLVEVGIIDSTGILELIEFLEAQFGIHVEETETTPENLGSIVSLTHYVNRKRVGDGSGI